MKKLLFALLLSSLPVITIAAPLTITFSKSLPVSKTTDQTKPGCETSTQGYIFDVTMTGWNLPTSTCTATNLFSNPGYLTAGQRAPRASAQTWMSPVIIGSKFSLVSLKIKNYSSTNTLYLDTITAEGTIYTTVIAPSITSIGFDPTATEFSNLTGISLRSTNNRFDITNIVVQ
jgi:hypothetical protein